jgi:hypothetical protein
MENEKNEEIPDFDYDMRSIFSPGEIPREKVVKIEAPIKTETLTKTNIKVRQNEDKKLKKKNQTKTTVLKEKSIKKANKNLKSKKLVLEQCRIPEIPRNSTLEI